MKGAQLALPVQLSQVPSFDNFFAGPNAEAVASLRQLAPGSAIPAIWIYGGIATGKTHLLHAAASAIGGQVLNLSESGAAARANVQAPLIAFDDLDQTVSDPDGALWLLRLIDQRRAQGLPLLFAAGAPPSRLAVALPDLLTRLEAMAVLGLKPLRELDRRELLRLHADARGLDLPADASAWLLAHLRRDAGSLIAALEELDRAALSAKRRPTLPFVQQVLGPKIQPSLALENGRTSSD